MIQRKQTVFLILAFLLTAVCLSIPVGIFIPEVMGVSQPMYNLWVSMGNGSHDLSMWPLFLILVLSATITLVDIFLYKNRHLQAKLCGLIIFLNVVWYVIWYLLGREEAVELKSSLNITVGTFIPLVCIILACLALRGINADEKLVRSMDRIR